MVVRPLASVPPDVAKRRKCGIVTLRPVLVHLLLVSTSFPSKVRRAFRLARKEQAYTVRDIVADRVRDW